MRRLIAVLAVVAACLSHAEAAPRKQPSAGPDTQSFDQIQRGRYLVLLGDCTPCHTAPDGKRFAGGRPLETPFGTVVAPNITPDAATGIGAMTDEQFVDALQRGIGHDGRHLYPAMPYPYYTRVTREDVLAIRAYLNSLEPVVNPVQANQLPFPFNIRAGMVAWNQLFFTPGEFKPTPDKSAVWNRGAYLVTGLGHCGACHTPKNALGGDETSHSLQGAPLQDWVAPDLTGDARTGLQSWSADDLVDYLRTGHNRTTAASGPMAEVVSASTSQMTDDDLTAIATYLKDQPAPTAKAVQAVKADDPAMRAGGPLYGDNCAACHAPRGEGVAHLFPALQGSALAQAPDPTTVIRLILRGSRSVATDRAPTAPAMPTFGWKLSDDQVAAVATFIRNSWGNAAPPVDARRVSKLRASLAERAD
ncbi:MAG: cytochrome c [Alphaproteobacteria bacterium]|nr:cytochrome c [Alphaproteobacteria bacterium]